MGKKTIYVPVEKEAMWERFKEACRRDSTYMSAVIIKKVEEWMMTHDPGNPQTAMTSFGEGGKITMAGIEGKIRQLCLERSDKTGELKMTDIIIFSKEAGIRGQEVRPFVNRVAAWLRDQGRKVWR